MQLKVCAPCSFLFCSLLTEFARFQTHCGMLVSNTYFCLSSACLLPSYFVLISILYSWQFNIICIHNTVFVYFFTCFYAFLLKACIPLFPCFPLLSSVLLVVIKWGCMFDRRIYRLISLYSCGYLLVYMFFLSLPLSWVFHEIDGGQAKKYKNADAVDKQNYVHSDAIPGVRNQAWPLTPSNDCV